MFQNAIVGSPDQAIIYINDSVSGRPEFNFRDKTLIVHENDDSISVAVVRTGDVSNKATVRCYTWQVSAQVMMDFGERPNSDSLLSNRYQESELRCAQ